MVRDLIWEPKVEVLAHFLSGVLRHVRVGEFFPCRHCGECRQRCFSWRVEEEFDGDGNAMLRAEFAEGRSLL